MKYSLPKKIRAVENGFINVDLIKDFQSNEIG